MVLHPARATIQAVLPLAIDGRDGRDLDRAVLQGRTLRRFFRQDERLCVNVVARGSQLQQIADALKPLETPWLEYRIIDENVVQAGLLPNSRAGRLRRQIVSMAAPEWLGASAWLTLDADVICLEPVGIEDLFPDGRALMALDHVGDEADRIRSAWATREVLGMVGPLATFAGPAAPLLLAAPIMRAVHGMLEALHGRPWKEVLLAEKFRDADNRDSAVWEETMLYGAVGARTGMLRQFHSISGIDTPQRLAAESGMALEAGPDRGIPASAGFFAACRFDTPIETLAESIAPLLAEGLAARTAPAGTMADAGLEAASVPASLRCRIISKDPIVLYGPQDRVGLANLLSRGAMEPFRAVPALLLLALPSSREAIADGRALAASIARRRRELPQHRVIVLCNTEVELDNLRELNVDCVLASDNIFIDERPFLPERGVRREFDAIYNAGFHPAKRHHLAARIESLAVLYPNWHTQYADYAAASRRALAHAAFLNHPTPQSDYRFFDRDGVAAQLARARVGLCLSDIEGAMRASIEYLFAGLPVVSTLSRGGRDQFFDSDFCVTVPPSPQLIADAVRELAKLDIPRAHVRRRTMHKLARHRERLEQITHQALAAMGCTRPPRLDWPWLVETPGFFSVADLHKALASR